MVQGPAGGPEHPSRPGLTAIAGHGEVSAESAGRRGNLISSLLLLPGTAGKGRS